MDIDNSNTNFFTLLENYNTHVPYRRGIILSELNTPCFPIVCQMILPQPLTIECLSKIQKKLFLCISYSSIIPCLPMINKYENEFKTDNNLRPFINYENAITIFTFNNLFNDNSKIENNTFVFYVDSNKFIFNENITKEIIKLLKPNMSIIPCELLKFINNNKLSYKKKNRAINLYQDYYNTLLECSNITNLFNVKHPIIELNNKNNLPGIDFSGFGYGESLKERRDKLIDMIKEIDKNKLRLIQLKTGTPLEILHSILIGIDIIITPYPEILASQGKALYFNFPKEYKCDHDLDYILKLLEDNCKFINELYKDNTNEYIDLKDNVYINDINVLIHEESIRKESRGYVNHLLASNEITAIIILSEHNWWMYEKLFNMVKDSIENNTLIGFIYNFIKINVK